MKNRFIALAASASMIPFAAFAGDFSALDTDGSGGLSYGEVRAVSPETSVEEFAAADADESGELSQAEFDSWKQTKAEPQE